jgi:hypothetical protein
VVMCAAMGIETGIDLRKLLQVGRRFRDQYLRMQPTDRERLLENAARSTGLPITDLESLEDYGADVEVLVQRSLEALKARGEATSEFLSANIAGFIHGIATYLRIRAWAPARSETIMSDLPPSPHLAHLLD